MTSKEALEKLLNDINEQGQVIVTNPNLMVTFNVNLEMFTTTIENALKDLERLEVLEKLVYTNQFENTKNIENEFGRAFTILQNHCVAMEDTLYASKVLIQLISKYEKLKKYEAFYVFIYNRFFIDLIEREDGSFKIGFEPKEPIQEQPRFVEVDYLLGNLLKEVLNDD